MLDTKTSLSLVLRSQLSHPIHGRWHAGKQSLVAGFNVLILWFRGKWLSRTVCSKWQKKGYLWIQIQTLAGQSETHFTDHARAQMEKWQINAYINMCIVIWANPRCEWLPNDALRKISRALLNFKIKIYYNCCTKDTFRVKHRSEKVFCC